jgi:hypothetical protein
LRNGLPDSGVMGRPKVCRLRSCPDRSPAARGAMGPRPGCEIVEWLEGLVARRIERRPVLAVLAACLRPRNNRVRQGCRGKLVADGRLCLAAKPVRPERPPLRLDPAIRSTARCAKVLIGRPERGNLRTIEQLLVANLLAIGFPIPHREAIHGTTSSFSHQHQLHTWIGDGLQANRHVAATGSAKAGLPVKLRLTVRSYCDKQAAQSLGIR